MVQTVKHSDSVPEIFFFEKVYFKKATDDKESTKNYPACKELTITRADQKVLNRYSSTIPGFRGMN